MVPKLKNIQAIPPIIEFKELGKEIAIILAFINDHGSITRLQLESLLGIKTATAIRTLKKLTESNIIMPVGKGKNTKYVLSNPTG